MKELKIQPVVPLNPIVHTGGQKQEGFEYNKDADFVICPAGEHSIRKAIQGSKKSGGSRSLVFYFDVEKCKTCPLREGCYKPGAKHKTYSIRIVAEHYKKQMEFELSEVFKERIKRKKIPRTGQGEIPWSLRDATTAVLTDFVVNAKRMVRLLGQTQPAS
jgi:hypothetical protein